MEISKVFSFATRNNHTNLDWQLIVAIFHQNFSEPIKSIACDCDLRERMFENWLPLLWIVKIAFMVPLNQIWYSIYRLLPQYGVVVIVVWWACREPYAQNSTTRSGRCARFIGIHLYQKQTFCFIRRHIKMIRKLHVVSLRVWLAENFNIHLSNDSKRWLHVSNRLSTRTSSNTHAIKWNKNNKNWNGQHLTRAHIKCSSLFSVCLFICAVLFTFRLSLSVFFEEWTKMKHEHTLCSIHSISFASKSKQSNSIVVWWTIVFFSFLKNKTKCQKIWWPTEMIVVRVVKLENV